MNFFRRHYLEFICGALMLFGLILSFFYLHIGGILVGLAIGLYFYEEIFRTLFKFTDYYGSDGIFKTVMLLGLGLYLLLVAPSFLIALVVGFGIMWLVRHLLKQ